MQCNVSYFSVSTVSALAFRIEHTLSFLKYITRPHHDWVYACEGNVKASSSILPLLLKNTLSASFSQFIRPRCDNKRKNRRQAQFVHGREREVNT